MDTRTVRHQARLSRMFQEQRITLGETGIVVNTMAVCAPFFDTEKGEWLAAILNVMLPENSDYEFTTTPSIDGIGNSVHVVCLDKMENNIVGFAEPAERQPVLAKYLAENVTTEQQKDEQTHD